MMRSGVAVAQAKRREFWTRIHRWLGLFAMVFLGLAAITGCVLAYAQPLDAALNADLFKRPEAARPLAPVTAVTRYEVAHPAVQVTGFPVNVPLDRNIPVNVAAKPGEPELEFDQVFLDRADGHVVGARNSEASWSRHGMVDALASFHFTLLAGDWGRWFMGIVALGWLISIPVGFYLTLPERRPLFAVWKRMWRFSFKSSFGRQMLDLHRASGLWLLFVSLVLAFTSVALNFYAEVWEPLAVKVAPLKHSLFDQPEPFPQGTRPTLSYADALDRAEAQAAAEGLGWQPATALYDPGWNLYGVTFTGNGTLSYRALGPVYLYFDAADGHFAHRTDPYSDSAGLVMIRVLYPLHSGQIGGPLTVLLIFLTGLATLEMCVTGAYVWWKKRRSRMAQRLAKQRLAAA
jgi:uncharacterized iron-regulated membrane protein